MMSAGGNPRSCGPAAASSRSRVSRTTICILGARQHSCDGVTVEALLAYHDEAADPRFTRFPGTFVPCIDAFADALQQQPHRLAIDGSKAFDAEDVVGACNILSPRGEIVSGSEFRDIDNERLEVIVITFGQIIVM